MLFYSIILECCQTVLITVYIKEVIYESLSMQNIISINKIKYSDLLTSQIHLDTCYLGAWLIKQSTIFIH